MYCHRRGAADLENPKRWKKFAKRERHNNASAPHSAPSFSILLLWNGKQWGGAIRTEIKAILKGLPTRKCSRKGRRALCPNAESIRCIVPLNHCWNLDLNIIYIYNIIYQKRRQERNSTENLWFMTAIRRCFVFVRRLCSFVGALALPVYAFHNFHVWLLSMWDQGTLSSCVWRWCSGGLDGAYEGANYCQAKENHVDVIIPGITSRTRSA